MKRDLYAEVSARIVAELEAGAAPWVKPWSATPGGNTPCNAVTNRPYSGCNVVLLWMAQAAGYRTPRFLTFKQALELGGKVRKGEHGTKVYFVKQLLVQDKEAGDNPLDVVDELTVGGGSRALRARPLGIIASRRDAEHVAHDRHRIVGAAIFSPPSDDGLSVSQFATQVVKVERNAVRHYRLRSDRAPLIFS